MRGIDPQKPLTYICASYRVFEQGEHYIKRLCDEYVLMMVFKGVLRFRENGVDYEVHPGQYHIHDVVSYQEGPVASDSPEYLFVHFYAETTDSDNVIPLHGKFDYIKCRDAMDKMNDAAHNGTLFEQNTAFYELLELLYKKPSPADQLPADHIERYLRQNYHRGITLDQLSRHFNYSKNYIIRMFRHRYGMTPFSYLIKIRVDQAKYMLISTSGSITNIAVACGFEDYSHFYKCFVKMTGMSPADFRKNNITE